jgi:excisionase family DNA binding protein
MTRGGDDALLLPSEVAGMLRIKVNSVYAAAAAGRLPAVRLWRGRRKSLLRFRRQDIEELIRRGAPAS